MSGASSEHDFVENDAHETRMTYDSTSRVPWYVIAAWVCVMSGLGIYFVLHWLRDIKAWGMP
jgi:hypothetical protein